MLDCLKIFFAHLHSAVQRFSLQLFFLHSQFIRLSTVQKEKLYIKPTGNYWHKTNDNQEQELKKTYIQKFFSKSWNRVK